MDTESIEQKIKAWVSTLDRIATSPDPAEAKEDKPDIWEKPGKTYFEYSYDKDNRLQSVVIRTKEEKQKQQKPEPARPKKARHKSGQILVKFKPEVSEETINSINARHHTKKIKKLARIDVYKLELPSGASAEEMAQIYQELPEVEYAEPNYIAYALVVPNDPEFTKQWGLNQASDCDIGGLEYPNRQYQHCHCHCRYRL
jgi:hypothetical protein